MYTEGWGSQPWLREGGPERRAQGLLLTVWPYPPAPTCSQLTLPPWALFRAHGPCLSHSPASRSGSSLPFFKSLVIELDKDLYGPDNHLGR